MTTIEWTDVTWNPVRGCSLMSPGCLNCYAMEMAHRFSGPGKPYENLTERSRGGKVRWNGQVRLVPELLGLPLRWRRPRMIFVNSMSDLFHEQVPLAYIRAVFAVMKRADWHVFQVLTKRSERLLELHEQLEWPRNVWMGVSVESARYVYRADHLRGTNARVKFLSVEPLLGPLPDLSVEGLDWVIVGGESGRRARPMELDWARQVRDKCVEAGVAFFLKQLGGRDDKRSGDDAVLDGRTWREYPKTLELEPYPNRESTRAGRDGYGDGREARR